MVATLTRIFGIEHLNLVEDVVQEALGRALQTWPYRGIPENPSAWIMRASRNLALDVIRREKVFRGKEAEIARLFESGGSSALQTVSFSENEIADDRLRMMFVCCHPIIPSEAQVALALKTLCGFSVIEISRAFLTTEAAIAKRVTRAKQKIQEAHVPLRFLSATSWRGDSKACCSRSTSYSTRATKHPVATNWFGKNCVTKRSVSRNYWHNIALEISQRRMRCWH